MFLLDTLGKLLELGYPQQDYEMHRELKRAIRKAVWISERKVDGGRNSDRLERAEKALKRNLYCALVTIDVKNAFNSTRPLPEGSRLLVLDFEELLPKLRTEV